METTTSNDLTNVICDIKSTPCNAPHDKSMWFVYIYLYILINY